MRGREASAGTAASRQAGVRAGPGRPFEAQLEPAEALRVELVDPHLLERVDGQIPGAARRIRSASIEWT